MRTYFMIATCVLLAACSHAPPHLPATVPAVPAAVPPHPIPKPPITRNVPLPMARPEMPDDRTPDHVCADLAKRRAQDAATLGDDAKKQEAVRESTYANCMGGTENPVP